MSDEPYPPNAEPMFQAIREHLRLAHSAGFLLFDKNTGYYVAVHQDLVSMSSMVSDQIEWNEKNGRDPDVMADTGEIVNVFVQTYPPKE